MTTPDPRDVPKPARARFRAKMASWSTGFGLVAACASNTDSGGQAALAPHTSEGPSATVPSSDAEPAVATPVQSSSADSPPATGSPPGPSGTPSSTPSPQVVNSAVSPSGRGGAAGSDSAGAAGGQASGGGEANGGGGTMSEAGRGGAGGFGGIGSASAGSSAAGSGAVPSEPIRVEADIQGAIPQQYKQPIDNAGTIVRRSYPCYYYTDQTEGLESEPSELILERRAQPITKELNVYLPHGYGAEQEYPVIYVLHGLTDNEDTWFERGDPHPAVLLDNLIDAGEIDPVIAVFPNGNSSSSFLTREFDNQAGYYYFANELVNDIIPLIEAEYSVRAERNSRAVCGFSMGGMQTINAGLCQSLEHFAWFGAFAAAPTTYTSDRIAQYVARANENASYPINYFYNICGESDDTRDSHEPALEGLTEKSEYLSDQNLSYHNVPGGHDYTVSSVGLYNFLRIFAGR